MSWDIAAIAFTTTLYAVAAYNCYRVLLGGHSGGAKIAWIMFIGGVPILGVPLYFLLGQNRIYGYVRRRQKQQEAFIEKSLAGGVADGAEAKPHKSYGSFSSDTFDCFRKFGPVLIPQPGHVELLKDGRETFRAIFQAIGEAQNFIAVQYYILRSDRLGLELRQLLVDKAKQGIAVYVLFDDMGSFWLRRDYVRGLEKAGVKVAKFLPVASLKRFFQINFRNHRKLVVIDGIVAFTGGLNVGEEYASRRFASKTPQSPETFWRDTHCKVSGRCVSQLLEVFLEDWHFATSEMIDDAILQTAEPLPHNPVGPKNALVQVFPTGPTDETHISILFLQQLIATAQSRLWIATPYFIPDQTLLHTLELAALRGVDVRLLIPRRGDNRIVHWASLSYATQMQRVGVKVCLYNPGFMHQKVVLVDDRLAAVGTMNFDSRAFYLNFETMLLIDSEGFAWECQQMLRKDFLNASFLRPAESRFRRQLDKTRNHIARLTSPLL